MKYQEKFEINQKNSPYFSTQFDVLITGCGSEDNERHTHFKKMLDGFKGKIYAFDTCENVDKFHYTIKDENNNTIATDNDKLLIPDLQILLAKNNFSGARICIDITTLKQGILFLLIKTLLTEIQPSRLFAAYTEPLEYKRKKNIEIGEAEEFDLYDKILGSSKSVPGFIKHQSTKEKLLIASMGFETQRLQILYESIKPKMLIPIVGFPSFVPGWNLTAIKMNYLVLKNADCYDMIMPSEAASPFDFYGVLEEQFHRHGSNYDIYISPLGTRPHCLGAALFASKYSSSYLIYDFPVEKEYRSESVLKASMYNLSGFIN